ncbi:L-rhamnose isomerase [Aerococcaceae bacterium zg-B36]|uniref:L-rhamnose isomerase n=1 Tax=Aerococcaceae bacterium zg-252 TaxID=2796928 RepID=UPI001BD8A074|nr:L-rhamnose isomerase [Aerococcaceae bacterium zg-B36]
MATKEQIVQAYELAKARYAELGVDTEEVLKRLANVKVSMHCWQGDDVKGFQFPDQELTGGISVSGNYPGAARTPKELRDDLDKAFSLIPGKHKLNLHAIYTDTDEKIDSDQIEPKHYQPWVDWAKKNGLGLDFNPTLFSHPKSAVATLSSADDEIRDFWIEHTRRSRRVSEYFGKETGILSVNNIWLPDGSKDNPIDRVAPRQRLLAALDAARNEEINPQYSVDAVEGKVFGMGAESFTVGTHEFYLAYALTRGLLWTIDSGHFHPTEDPADKMAAVKPFNQGLYLHVSRPVRWDSDHVVIMDDVLQRITETIVNNDLLETTHIGLDFFDATINRVAAWVIGTRNTIKAVLLALLAPLDTLKEVELAGDFTKRLALTEELKSLPFAAVWDYYCLQNNVPVGTDWIAEVEQYEKDVLSKRS